MTCRVFKMFYLAASLNNVQRNRLNGYKEATKLEERPRKRSSVVQTPRFVIAGRERLLSGLRILCVYRVWKLESFIIFQYFPQDKT